MSKRGFEVSGSNRKAILVPTEKTKMGNNEVNEKFWMVHYVTKNSALYTGHLLPEVQTCLLGCTAM
jgi:hypothetical protein